MIFFRNPTYYKENFNFNVSPIEKYIISFQHQYYIAIALYPIGYKNNQPSQELYPMGCILHPHKPTLLISLLSVKMQKKKNSSYTNQNNVEENNIPITKSLTLNNQM